MLPISERPEQTRERLYALAQEELNEALQAGGIAATAVDGSLGSGRLWPSSDLDVTVVPDTGREWGVEWRIRGGIVVHKHRNRWPLLQGLRDGYPQSFVETAGGEWVRDPTWLLDGLAGMEPVHDPGGRLQAFREFMREHRFRPEVVEPRRPLLWRRARKLRQEASGAFAAGEEVLAAEHVELAIEALALIWLEADHRLISSKEMDPALRVACQSVGAPGAHRLFRAAAGVGAAGGPQLAAIAAAFRRLLLLFSDWLDAVLAVYPSGLEALDRPLPWWVYHRHRLWSALYAPERDCLLHRAVVRLAVGKFDLGELQDRSALAVSAGAALRSASEEIGPMEAARWALVETFSLAPPQEQLEALDALIALTERTFQIGESG